MAKIYVVAVDADVRTAISHALEGRGHEIVAARSGKGALSHLEAEAPDLVIGDVELPDLDGAMISTFVRQSPILQTTPVVLLAPDLDEEVEGRARRSGADEVLASPPPAAEVVATVERLLASPEASSAPETREEVAVAADDGASGALATVRLPVPEAHRHHADLLEELAAQIDLRFAAVLASTGEAVRVEGSAPWLAGTCGDELVRLALLASAVSSRLGHGRTGGLLIESAGGTLLLEPLPEQHLLVVGVADRSALGKARYLLRKLRRRFREEDDPAA